MILYKKKKQFNKDTGEETKPILVPCGTICDFTGDLIEEYTNFNIMESECTYEVGYGDHDSCFGSVYNEYKLGEKYKFDCDLLSEDSYMFKTIEGFEIFSEMLETAKKEYPNALYSIAGLFRWSRCRMLEKLLAEGKYKVEDFILGYDDRVRNYSN